MKLYLLLGLSFFSSLFGMDVSIESDIALVMNADTGKVLFEKNADRPVFPASLTKIAAALFAIKEVGDDLDVSISADQDCVGSITAEMQKSMDYKYPPHWLIIGGTHMDIKNGASHTLEQLLYGMLLLSANDATNVVAKYVSGTISQFVMDLNEYLEEIGCTQTRFMNPHGLHYPKHISTAKDIAIITSEAMKYPLFRKIVATQKYGSMRNSNFLLRPGSEYYYPYAIGVKTGFQSESGCPLVAAAEHEGRTLIAVLLECPTKAIRYQDTRKLFEAAFAEQKVDEVYLEKGKQSFKYKIDGIKKPLTTYLDEKVSLSYYPSEKPNVKGTVHWHPPAFPIEKGDIVADLILTDEEGQLLKEVPLYSAKKIKSTTTGKGMKWFLVLFSILLLGFFGFKSIKV